MKFIVSGQLIRYLVIGAVSNLAGYVCYLFLTYFDLAPKIAMTLLYATTATLSFFGNRKITFLHEGSWHGAGVRFLAVQAIGYLINLSILMVFVDRLGYHHQLVQAGAIIAVAVYLFISLKFFVFRRAL